MKAFLRYLLLALAVGSALLVCGCESDDAAQQAQTQVPWSRPTQWEGGIPGMTGMGQR